VTKAVAPVIALKDKRQIDAKHGGTSMTKANRQTSDTAAARPTVGQWISGQSQVALIKALRLLPYRARVRFGGWLFANVVAPLGGHRQRILNNLELVRPDLDMAERERIARRVPNNVGRTIFELFSGDDFISVARNTPIDGPGLTALEKARDEGRPVILVSGHFGNYDVIRAALIARGFRMGALYRPMSNPYFNKIYVETISQIGEPMFDQGRHGMAAMVKFLRSGGALAILHDQRIAGAEMINFFGKPARTGLSTAKLALKYGATVIPFYAIRQPDGFSFRVVSEDPIPEGDAVEMSQALNDSLEAQIRQNMDQWLWNHRRWK